jgi:4-hydroxybenzoate polyprenyltransferase
VIVAYLRERIPLSFFGPLALVLAACALAWPPPPVELAVTAIAALSLLAQFRAWDDLADRRIDAVAHPDRVLVKAETHRSLVGLAFALMVINASVAAERGLSSVALLVALHAALGGYYLLRRHRTVLSDQLLLGKYPAFVLILAGERLTTAPLPLGLTAGAVYVAASAYEAWHDPLSPLAQLMGGRS